MSRNIAAALRTAKRYADGGGDDSEDESKAWADNSPTVADVPGVGVVPTSVPPIAKALAQQQADWIATPGKLMQQQPGEELKPGMISDEDIARQQIAQDQRSQQEIGWGANTALGMAGTEIPFAPEGAIGAFGGTGAPVKAPAPVASADLFSELHPVDVASAQKIGGSQGSSPGGFYTGFADGQDRYIKEAKSEDHAKNEKLAAELYKEVGIPSAQVELTRLPNGKPGISSPIIEGEQLGQNYGPSEYRILPDLQKGLPADQWLANYDVLGQDHDNVIVNDNGQHRIDFGGALMYRAQGKPKTDWGPEVKELQTMHDPDINQNTAAAFTKPGEDPINDVFRQDTAQRIADIPDARIQQLVQQYGPGSAKTKAELASDLIARRDQIAEHYLGSKPVPPEPAPTPTPDIGGVKQYRLDDPELDAQNMLHNHEWYDDNGKPTGTYNAEGIADNMYKMAALGHSAHVDKMYQHLPEDIQPDVNGHLSQMIQEKGDPWSGDFHPALDAWNPPQPAPDDWYNNEPLTDKEWEEILGSDLSANVAPKMDKPTPGIMQINKAHSTSQVVSALNDLPLQVAQSQSFKVTPKQVGKIQSIINSKPAERLATAMFGLDKKGKNNLYSWMTQKQMDKVGDAMADLAAKKESVPNYTDEDIKRYYEWQDETEAKHQAIDKGEEFKPSISPSSSPYTASFYKNNIIPAKWSSLTFRNSSKWTPLDIPNADLEELIREHGANPHRLWHGSSKWGPQTKLEGGLEYPHYLEDPTEYKQDQMERGFFLSPEEKVGKGYAGQASPFVGFANKAGVLDWSKAQSDLGYSTIKMDKAIEAAHAMNLDALVVKNIRDVPGSHLQDQIIFLKRPILRAPHATFDRKMLHKAIPLAGVVGGFSYTYGKMPGEQQPQGQMARGGKVRSYTVPLHPGSSNKVKSENISEFHTGPTYAHTKAKFGKARADAQAIAAAYANAKRHPKKKAGGGPNLNFENIMLHGASYGLRKEGMINSSIPGRTDKLPMNVKSGSYILPADVPSALGQGNSAAGGKILSKMFSSGPYGISPMKGGAKAPHMPSMHFPKQPQGMFAKGGQTKEESGHVPIIAAGGEFIIDPAVVRDIGHGDIKAGHKVLDKFVLSVRKKHVDTLKKLPGPKK